MDRRGLLIGGSALALASAGTVAWHRSTGSMADYDRYATALRAPLDTSPSLPGLIRYATLAANGHNTQPWCFVLQERTIRLYPDESRRTPVVDPDDHHLYVSLGCAMENLAIAARAIGQPGEVAIDDGDAIAFRFGDGPTAADPLFAAIPRRQSTRSVYDGRPIPPADLTALEQAAAEPGVRLILLTDRHRISQMRDLVLAGNNAQWDDQAFMTELQHWIRFNPRDAMRYGDGLFAAASGSPNLPAALGAPAFSLVTTARGERDRYARQMVSTPAVAVFVGDTADRAHWMKVGRACQRLMLTATARGLKHAFVNQPVEVTALRPFLAALIGEPDKRPDLVLRLGYGPTLPYAPRRPVETVVAAG
ncbi:Acg family FMN-binding oxidoreductase [Nitrospirillum viridazoti]|uniref:Tat pathway signal protein n=1 Tax=Nitrospirillum viridazoti CBAmc TaxID=1441467 RepID=A0A248JTD5_9PROT|nr:nitroreductase family protein [Nitrospirillum amazonense]ASG21368.1 Tat pathway signal protein [Nitrospirillum amazonense CBAmc]TWB33043.1 nitroreductase family protein [Nitrospirillum amazonense]